MAVICDAWGDYFGWGACSPDADYCDWNQYPGVSCDESVHVTRMYACFPYHIRIPHPSAYKYSIPPTQGSTQDTAEPSSLTLFQPNPAHACFPPAQCVYPCCLSRYLTLRNLTKTLTSIPKFSALSHLTSLYALPHFRHVPPYAFSVDSQLPTMSGSIKQHPAASNSMRDDTPTPLPMDPPLLTFTTVPPIDPMTPDDTSD